MESGDSIAIPLPFSFKKEPTSIEEKGKIVTINFDDGDFIKLSTYAKEIMAGQITFDTGVYTADEKYRLIYKNSVPIYLKMALYNGYQNVGSFDYTIPVGSSFYPSTWVQDYCSFALPDYFVADTDITQFVIAPDNAAIYFEGKFKQRADIEQKAKEREKQKDVSIYNSYCEKYGKQWVDLALTPKIAVGMPINMIKDMFKTSLHTDYGARQLYTVIISKPIYFKATGELTSRETGASDPFHSKAIISINNGVVESISYTK